MCLNDSSNRNEAMQESINLTRHYEALILDFDGVILNSEPLHYKACCHVFSEIGISLTYSDYLTKYLGLSDKQMFPLSFLFRLCLQGILGQGQERSHSHSSFLLTGE